MIHRRHFGTYQITATYDLYSIYVFFFCYYLFLSGAVAPFTVKKEGPATAEEHLLLRELNVVLER